MMGECDHPGVLTGCYSCSKDDVVAVLQGLLRTKGFQVEAAETAWKAVRLFKGGSPDFADCLIECSDKRAGCDYTATFDRDAARHCGMRLVA